ncbi:MAG: TorF family putative porin [Pseudomonadota bacterium]
MIRLQPKLFVALILAFSVPSHAEWSGNVGWASDYHFRGIFQSDSSASLGVDYENAGWYVGTWAADVDDGAEVDLYFGFGGEYGEFSYGIGFTGYYYTGDFDDTYQEINLSAGYGAVTLDVAIGEYDNFDGPTQDYTFFSLTAEHNDFYATLGSFSQDADGEYLELGYGTEVSGFDLGVAIIFANDDLIGDADESIVFSLGKSFSF